MTFAVFISQYRTTVRSFQTPLFLAIGVVASVVPWFYFGFAHASVSDSLLSGGYTGTRYLSSYLFAHLLWFCLLALVFVCADVCSNDDRSRITESLHAKPLTNFALLGGRVAAIATTGWVTVLVSSGTLQAIGVVARAASWPLDVTVEPVAWASFLLVDAIPVMFCWCAVIVLVTVIVRSRSVAVLVALLILGAQAWAFGSVPQYLLPSVSIVSGDLWNSDIVPQFADVNRLMQRGGIVAIGLGALFFGAACLRRKDGLRRRNLGCAFVFGSIGIAGLLVLVLNLRQDVQLREMWQLAAEVPETGLSVADVEVVSGEVNIRPGEMMELDLAITLRMLESDEWGDLLFRLNPGLRVTGLRILDLPAAFQQENGLLQVKRPDADWPDGSVVLHLHAVGVPDARFAYLDESVDWQLKSRRNRIGMLGTAASMFEDRFVALLPGSSWLPTTANPHHPSDFFLVDIAIEVPSAWWVAGPGRRRAEDAVGPPPRRRFRFRTGAPVPEVGIVAAPFERHASDLGGVEVEVLMHAGHTENFDRLAEVAGSAILRRVSEILEYSNKLGIPYPYTALSLVEVPSRLRGYKGGWRMDTALAMPGVILFKEHTFPSARLVPTLASWRGQEPSRVASLVESYFNHDYTDGRLLPAFTRNLFAFQVGPTGDGAEAVELLCDELIALAHQQRRTGRVNAFSAHAFDYEVPFGAGISDTFLALFAGSIYRVITTVYPNLDATSVWERMLTNSLVGLGVTEKSNRDTAYALMRRSALTAQAIMDSMGPERSIGALAALRRRHEGSHFDLERFATALREHGGDPTLLHTWFNTAGAPGYSVSAATVSHVPNSAKYQTSVHIHNGETAPGIVRLGTSMFSLEGGSPVLVPGQTSVEIGFLTSQRPTSLYLLPYFSYNRHAVRVELPTNVAPLVVPGEMLEGSRASDWIPAKTEGIVIDDLDPGFSSYPNEAGWRIKGAWAFMDPPKESSVGAIPDQPRWIGEWGRLGFPSAWGRYYRSVGWAMPGDGRERVAFTTTLLTGTEWRLEYYLPDRFVPNAVGAFFGDLGTIDIELRWNGFVKSVPFEGGNAEPGWNSLGRYEIGPGRVTVVISNRTDGDIVLADAVRWIPVTR